MSGLSGVHNILGTIVVVAFLALTVLNVLRVTGRDVALTPTLSRLAAILLLAQYVVGFLLLGSGFRNATSHYVLALLAIATVGLEHGYAATRSAPHQRAIAATIATLGTTVLVIAAHGIGSAYRGGVEAALARLP